MAVQYPLTKFQRAYLPMKRAADVILSGGAIIILSPLLGAIAIAIKLESPGPVLFRQKRVGKDGTYFEILKFRSMRTDTPKDLPTHMLSDPDQYITKVGRFIRKTSLDELPQIINIFKGEMSIIGPRPALWNQYDLIEEREKYGANSVTPGLTGWAQINGRDELEIPVKARLDGEYVEKLGPVMDLKCFLGTIGSVLSSDGVVEGGTGKMESGHSQSATDKTAKGETAVHEERGNDGKGQTQTAYDADPLKQTRKLKQEILTGAAVVTVGCGIGIAVLYSLFKWTKKKRLL